MISQINEKITNMKTFLGELNETEIVEKVTHSIMSHPIEN